jgi:hypothetical protein
VPLAAAMKNPCLLVTLPDAESVLGKGTRLVPPAASAGPSCSYGNLTSLASLKNLFQSYIFIYVQAGLPGQAESALKSPQPVTIEGHHGACGANPVSSAPVLVAAIDSTDVLIVDAPTCPDAEKLATTAFSRLA